MRQLTALDEQFLALEGPRHYGHVGAVAVVDPSTTPGGRLELLMNTVDPETLETRIEWEHFAVNRGGHLTQVRPFPISVATDRVDSAAGPAELPHIERAALLERLGVRASYMGVGVDRIDYTKGIPERFRGIEAFLENCPSYRGS